MPFSMPERQNPTNSSAFGSASLCRTMFQAVFSGSVFSAGRWPAVMKIWLSKPVLIVFVFLSCTKIKLFIFNDLRRSIGSKDLWIYYVFTDQVDNDDFFKIFGFVFTLDKSMIILFMIIANFRNKTEKLMQE